METYRRYKSTAGDDADRFNRPISGEELKKSIQSALIHKAQSVFHTTRLLC